MYGWLPGPPRRTAVRRNMASLLHSAPSGRPTQLLPPRVPDSSGQFRTGCRREILTVQDEVLPSVTDSSGRGVAASYGQFRTGCCRQLRTVQDGVLPPVTDSSGRGATASSGQFRTGCYRQLRTVQDGVLPPVTDSSGQGATASYGQFRTGATASNGQFRTGATASYGQFRTGCCRQLRTVQDRVLPPVTDSSGQGATASYGQFRTGCYRQLRTVQDGCRHNFRIALSGVPPRVLDSCVWKGCRRELRVDSRHETVLEGCCAKRNWHRHRKTNIPCHSPLRMNKLCTHVQCTLSTVHCTVYTLQHTFSVRCPQVTVIGHTPHPWVSSYSKISLSISSLG